jgi:hypothetical protein
VERLRARTASDTTVVPVPTMVCAPDHIGAWAMANDKAFESAFTRRGITTTIAGLQGRQRHSLPGPCTPAPHASYRQGIVTLQSPPRVLAFAVPVSRTDRNAGAAFFFPRICEETQKRAAISMSATFRFFNPRAMFTDATRMTGIDCPME